MSLPAFRAVVLLLAAIATTACESSRMGLHQPVVSDRLFCGRSIPGGSTVSDEDWDAFVEQVVTPRFPDGLTLYDARGQWRDGGATEKERVTVIEVLHPPSSRADRLIREIAEEYRRRFAQRSVLRVTMPAGAEFIRQ